VVSVQTSQLIAQIISIVGMVAVSFGWLSAEQVSSITTNILATIGPLMTLGGLAYSLYSARKNAVVTAVAAMPEVRAVVTENNQAGRDLAHSDNTPSNVVVGQPPGAPIPTAPVHP
jgi:hypothetical protein